MKIVLIFLSFFTLQVQAQNLATPSIDYDVYYFNIERDRALALQIVVTQPDPSCAECSLIGDFRTQPNTNLIGADFEFRKPMFRIPDQPQLESEKFIVNGPTESLKVFVPSGLKLLAWTLSTKTLDDVKPTDPTKTVEKGYKSFTLDYGGPYTATTSTEAIQNDCNVPAVYGDFTYLSSADYEFVVGPSSTWTFSVGCQPLPKPKVVIAKKTKVLQETGWGYKILVPQNFELIVTK